MIEDDTRPLLVSHVPWGLVTLPDVFITPELDKETQSTPRLRK